MKPKLLRLRGPSELLFNVRTFRTSRLFLSMPRKHSSASRAGKPLPRLFGKETLTWNCFFFASSVLREERHV